MPSTVFFKLELMLQRFIQFTGQLISWVTLGMMLLTVAVVIMRYVFNSANIMLQESVMYMHSALFLIGAAYTLQKDGHVRVDIFYRQYSDRQKAWVNLFGGVFLLLPCLIFIMFMSWDYVGASWSIQEKSVEGGGLAFVYLLKSLILIMPLLLLVQGIADSIMNIRTLISQSSAQRSTKQGEA